MPPASHAGRPLPAYWSKAVRDLRMERTRSACVVLAIAIGIAAFGTVLSSYAILVRELNRGYLDTHPASAVLRTDRVDDALLAQVTKLPGVGDAEARRVLRGRIKAGPAEWRSLTLFVVEDYGDIRISRLVPQAGAWPPATGEILIERDALQVARARIGDLVAVRTAGGTERTLKLSGSVHDVGQAQARMENIVYGYGTVNTLALLGEEPYLDQLTLVVAGHTLDEAHVRGVAEGVKTWLLAEGHPVHRMDVPKPGQHPHADLMGMLLLSMVAFGLFALVLSGILVVNLLTALLAAQVRQIGVMKAVGGTRWLIARVYLAQALLVGVAAWVVAVPLGMWGSRVLCRYLAVFLNFDIASFAVPAWVYLLEALVGLLVPLLAAAYPVARGTRISVREAFADYGVAQSAFGTTAFDRALTTVAGTTRPLLLALRNGFRRRARLALTLATLAAGGLFFMSALNVRASLIRTIDRLFDSMKYDLTVGLGGLQPLETLERAVRRTPGVLRAEGWVTTEATLVPANGASPASSATPPPHAPGRAAAHGGAAQSPDRFTLMALPAGSDFVAPDIIEGRGLRRGDTNALLVNNTLAARDSRFHVGGEVTLRLGHREASWQVVGVTREPFSPALGYIPLAHLEELGGQRGMASSLRLVLERKDPASISAVKASLDQNLEREGVRALNSLSGADRRVGFDEHMRMIYVFLIVMSSVLAVVGGLGLTTTMSLNVLERRREMGVLRAIGAAPRTVWLIVVAEAVVIGTLSWALAAVVAWPFSRTLADLLVRGLFRTRLDFVFEPSGLVVWLSVCVLLAAVASLLPAWHASRCPVREAIAYE
jgi:putative ABC transport system permease protein